MDTDDEGKVGGLIKKRVIGVRAQGMPGTCQPQDSAPTLPARLVWVMHRHNEGLNVWGDGCGIGWGAAGDPEGVLEHTRDPRRPTHLLLGPAPA
jgi:hypothetical protein